MTYRCEARGVLSANKFQIIFYPQAFCFYFHPQEPHFPY